MFDGHKNFKNSMFESVISMAVPTDILKQRDGQVRVMNMRDSDAWLGN